jgi:predicted dienelactone hydrolase
VLYSHGLGGSREGGDAWGEAWRAAGLAVIHLQHPGSDTEVLRSGWREARAATRPERLAEQLGERVRDMQFALDTVARLAARAEAPWARLLDQPMGVAGHSFGAHTVQALAGQRYRVPADFADRRPRAFIALSPSPGRGELLPPREAFGAVERPFLAVTGSLDGDPFGTFERGEPRAAVFAGLPAGQRALLWLDGADHMTFAGNAERRLRSGALLKRTTATIEAEPRHHALVARVSTLWWRAQLLGDARAKALLADASAAAGGASLGLGPGDRWQMD